MARFGFGSPHKKTSAATSIAVPVNSVAPVIAGDTTDSGLLTISSEGTWSNSPSSYQHQWKSDGTNIPGETGSTFTKTSAYQGHTITLGVRGYNGSLGAEAVSNAIGPISSASMATPTWTRFGSAGTAPLVMSLSSTDTNLAGYRYQWEFAASLTPTKNGDGSYTTPSQGDVTFLDGDSWARLDQTVPSFNTPSGAFATHSRILRDNENGAVSVTDALGQSNTYDASAWSTDYTDTISASVTTWASSTGTDKSQYIDISGGNLTATVNANVNDNCGVRGNFTPPASSKRYFEVTVGGHGAMAAGTLSIGITDDSTALGAAVFPHPGGASGGGGCSFLLKNGTVQNNVSRNGAQVAGTALSTNLADADKLGILSDDSLNTVALYHKPGAGAWYLVQTVTMTSQIPANRRPYMAGFGTGDQGIANFGATAFNRTLGGGELMWG